MQLKHDVFISYSRKNTEFADALHEALQKAKLNVWMDRSGIEGGTEWEQEIQEALQSSRMMLLVISQPSMKSENVKDEIATALTQGVSILPVKIEELLPRTPYAMRLNRLQWIDATTDQSQKKLDEIVAAAHKKLDLAPPIPVSPEEASEKTTAVATATEDAPESSDSGLSITKEEFLSQCAPSEKQYFAEVLAYCESHPKHILIDWGGKGFSIKDSNRRQILWMFPKEGANSKSNINARLQKLLPEEKEQVMEILRANGIVQGLSWRPAELPLGEIQKIIALVCGI